MIGSMATRPTKTSPGMPCSMSRPQARANSAARRLWGRSCDVGSHWDGGSIMHLTGSLQNESRMGRGSSVDHWGLESLPDECLPAKAQSYDYASWPRTLSHLVNKTKLHRVASDLERSHFVHVDVGACHLIRKRRLPWLGESEQLDGALCGSLLKLGHLLVHLYNGGGSGCQHGGGSGCQHGGGSGYRTAEARTAEGAVGGFGAVGGMARLPPRRDASHEHAGRLACTPYSDRSASVFSRLALPKCGLRSSWRVSPPALAVAVRSSYGSVSSAGMST